MSNVIKIVIEVIQGDITKLAVNAIVNAANSTLLGGGWGAYYPVDSNYKCNSKKVVRMGQL